MKISVAMCTYNGEKYISEQINSILSQTVLPDEIIICDDGSTDNTIEIINKLNNPRIKLQLNPVNLGITRNFEQAIKMCSGDIIFLSDQDDVWMKNKIETIIEAFSNNPEAYMVFTDGYLTDKNLQPYSTWSMWESSGFNSQEFNLDMLLLRTIVAGSTMAIKKEALELILPLSPNVTHDDWIALILTYFNRTSPINKKLIYYRLNKEEQIDMVECKIKPAFEAKARKNSIIAQFREKLLESKQKLTGIKNYTPILQFLNARLSVLMELPVAEPYLMLNDYIEHLERRSTLPKNKISRWKAISKEMPRYLRYENRIAAIVEWLNI